MLAYDMNLSFGFHFLKFATKTILERANIFSMITWLDMWIMQIWAANKITIATYVASNFLFANYLTFYPKTNIEFHSPSVGGMHVYFSFPFCIFYAWYNDELMWSWHKASLDLFQVLRGDKKVQRWSTTPSKPKCHCWVVLGLYLDRIFSKCCQPFPSVTWGACGCVRWPRLLHSPITTYESERNKQKLKCCSWKKRMWIELWHGLTDKLLHLQRITLTWF